MNTLGTRVKELRKLAKKRGVADQVGDLFDPRMAVRAYAAVLGLNIPLAFDLSLTLKQVEQISALLPKS